MTAPEYQEVFAEGFRVGFARGRSIPPTAIVAFGTIFFAEDIETICRRVCIRIGIGVGE